MKSQEVGRCAVSYVRQYTLSLRTISHIFSQKPVRQLFYFTTSNKFNRI